MRDVLAVIEDDEDESGGFRGPGGIIPHETEELEKRADVSLMFQTKNTTNVKKTASMRFRRSIMPWSSFALVGFAT